MMSTVRKTRSGSQYLVYVTEIRYFWATSQSAHKTDEMSDKRLFYGQQKSSRPSLTPCDTMWSWSARLIDIPTATADAKTETGLASEDRASGSRGPRTANGSEVSRGINYLL